MTILDHQLLHTFRRNTVWNGIWTSPLPHSFYWKTLFIVRIGHPTLPPKFSSTKSKFCQYTVRWNTVRNARDKKKHILWCYKPKYYNAFTNSSNTVWYQKFLFVLNVLEYDLKTQPLLHAFLPKYHFHLQNQKAHPFGFSVISFPPPFLKRGLHTVPKPDSLFHIVFCGVKLPTYPVRKTGFNPHKGRLPPFTGLKEIVTQHHQMRQMLAIIILNYTAKLLFHQSPTRHSDYHCDNVVTVL